MALGTFAQALTLPHPDRSSTRDVTTPARRDETDWLDRFHRGDRGALEHCYREHFATVERAVGSILGGADRETVIHELFGRLLAREDLRRSFKGGALGAWLATVARNLAIDYRRREAREVAMSGTGDGGGEDSAGAPTSPSWEDAAEAHLLIEAFRRDHLPAEWRGVFELRFLAQLPQREAAHRLSLHRTTLAYRELRIRRLLKRFLLDPREEDES